MEELERERWWWGGAGRREEPEVVKLSGIVWFFLKHAGRFGEGEWKEEKSGM